MSEQQINTPVRIAHWNEHLVVGPDGTVADVVRKSWAREIARAVNCHTVLLDAARLIHDWWNEYQVEHRVCLFCGPQCADNCPMAEVSFAVTLAEGGTS